MTPDNKYKNLSIILGIIALAFAVLYFTKPESTVGDLYQETASDIKKCNEKIADWKKEYGTQASSTDKQNELDEIIEDCKDEIESSSEKLGE